MTPHRKKILIVDDEPLARERIRRFLFELEVTADLAEAQNGAEALEIIFDWKPEIVFLDIQMPGLTGFEVLQQVEDRSFQLIFQTAYDQYAIKAFEENAVDYLLKPFSRERFQTALEKAFSMRAQVHSLSHLEASLRKEETYLERIAIRQSGKTKIIPLDSVECFTSSDHYTCIHSSKNQWLTELSLSWLEERINPDHFVRLHRNNIVSLKQIKTISGTNKAEVELYNGMKLPLSRNHRKKVLQLLSN